MCQITISFTITFRDPRNQAILQQLIREVKALNSMFLTEHIKGMWVYMSAFICILPSMHEHITSVFVLCLTDTAYRFYRTRTEEESSETREGIREEQDEKEAWEDYKSEQKFGLIKDPFVYHTSVELVVPFINY